jgi:hypothetical protein
MLAQSVREGSAVEGSIARGREAKPEGCAHVAPGFSPASCLSSNCAHVAATCAVFAQVAMLAQGPPWRTKGRLFFRLRRGAACRALLVPFIPNESQGGWIEGSIARGREAKPEGCAHVAPGFSPASCLSSNCAHVAATCAVFAQVAMLALSVRERSVAAEGLDPLALSEREGSCTLCTADVRLCLMPPAERSRTGRAAARGERPRGREA